MLKNRQRLEKKRCNGLYNPRLLKLPSSSYSIVHVHWLQYTHITFLLIYDKTDRKIFFFLCFPEGNMIFRGWELEELDSIWVVFLLEPETITTSLKKKKVKRMSSRTYNTSPNTNNYRQFYYQIFLTLCRWIYLLTDCAPMASPLKTVHIC